MLNLREEKPLRSLAVKYVAASEALVKSTVTLADVVGSTSSPSTALTSAMQMPFSIASFSNCR